MEARPLFEEANRRYWDELESIPIPGWMPFPYNMVNEVEKGNWPHFIDMMVSDELRETINLMNAWWSALLGWSIWVKILPTFDHNDRSTLQMQHVDPLAFMCMYQPSATRDRFCMIATNAVHQANCIALPGYKDRLDQDDLPKGRFLNRAQKEKQLVRLGQDWSKFGDFQRCLNPINDKDYRKVTRDFRNHSSHAIAPRFEWGYTNAVTRYMTPSEKMAKQPDGTFTVVKDHSRMVVAYGFGGMPPLKYEDMVAESRKQHNLAAAALEAYQTLLREVLQKIGMQTDVSAVRSEV